MKSRNKFLLILLVLALSFCLAFVSSAAGVGDFDNEMQEEYISDWAQNYLVDVSYYRNVLDGTFYEFAFVYIWHDVDGYDLEFAYIENIHDYYLFVSNYVDLSNVNYDYRSGVILDELSRNVSFSLPSQYFLDYNLLYELCLDYSNSLYLYSDSFYDEGYDEGYHEGWSDAIYDAGSYDEGFNDGTVTMYNDVVNNINTTFKSDYPGYQFDGNFDLSFINDAYLKAFEAGELYQLNKATDDGGISDFLADISGTVLSTFFYLATNISFMGTSALSLISLFVIAVIVIFILKFVIKS